MKPLIFTEQYHSGLLSFFYNEEGFLLFQAEQTWVMMLDQCSHLKIPLSTGWLEDGCVVCPWHQWKFNSQGHCTWPPPAHEERVSVFPIVEKSGIIWLKEGCEKTHWSSIIVDKHWKDVQAHIAQENCHWVGMGNRTLIWFGGLKEEVDQVVGNFDVSIFATE